MYALTADQLYGMNASGCSRPETFGMFAGMGFEESAHLERTVKTASSHRETKNDDGKDDKMYNNISRRLIMLVAAYAASILLVACDTKPEVKNITAPTPATTATPAISPEVANPNEAAIQQLIGKWNGPDGTYISITEKKGADGKQQLPRKFAVEIKGLDASETFDATAKGKEIEFVRKGKTETVKHATGAETGVKGFEKETACVVVTKGREGFCRKAEAVTESSPNSSPEKK